MINMATYAFTDIHGNYNLWKQIKNYCAEDDILFFLGDAIDRRPDGIKIMQEMFLDKRVIYLLGNHEDLLLDYIEIGIGTVMRDKQEMELIKYNESLDTLRDYQKLSIFDKEDLVYNLKNKTFIKYIYNNKENKKIVLCHSGCNPKKINGEYSIKDYIWDRKHLTTKANDWDKNYNDYIVIHGHTPVQLMKNLNKPDMGKDEIEIYCGGHKIDLDLATFCTNKIALLNLDTFEVKYFIDKENINE